MGKTEIAGLKDALKEMARLAKQLQAAARAAPAPPTSAPTPAAAAGFPAVDRLLALLEPTAVGPVTDTADLRHQAAHAQV
jgi:hypothetical protein